MFTPAWKFNRMVNEMTAIWHRTIDWSRNVRQLDYLSLMGAIILTAGIVTSFIPPSHIADAKPISAAVISKTGTNPAAASSAKELPWL